MKNLFILFAIFYTAILSAQDKPGKLRIVPGFLSNKYEIGDKTTRPKLVEAHLKTHDPDAYHQWKNANKSDLNGAIFGIIGLTGLATGIFASNNELQLSGYGLAVVGLSGQIVCLINSQKRRTKSINSYNSKFGY